MKYKLFIILAMLCMVAPAFGADGEEIWVRTVGSSGSDLFQGVGIGLANSNIAAGLSSGSITLNKHTFGGVSQWARTSGGGGGQVVTDAVGDSAGDVIFVGYYSGSLSLGGSLFTSAGGFDIFIAKYSGVDGSHLWSHAYGSIRDDIGYGVTVDSNDNVIFTGFFHDDIDFGGSSTPMSPWGAWDTFVTKLTTHGVTTWATQFVNNAADIGYGVAVDSSDNIYTAGYFMGTANFGGGESNKTSVGAQDIYLWKMDPNASATWSYVVGSATDDIAYAVTVDPNDEVLVTGYFKGATVDFNDDPNAADNLTSAGAHDVFILEVDPNGAHQWADSHGGANVDIAYAIDVDPNHQPLITGYFQGSANYGGGAASLVSAGSDDIFVAHYQEDGTHLWSKRYGSTGTDKGYDAEFDGTDRVVIVGSFQGTVDWTVGTITSQGGGDAFKLGITFADAGGGAGETPDPPVRRD